MKQANTFVTTAFWALLAVQTPNALSQETRTLSEPFRTDVTEVLNWQRGELVQVNNPTELAEKYKTGSSVIVEWEFGLTDRVLQKLQQEINEKYAHLNVLVYLAEDGKSFEEYNWKRLNSSDLCDTNPWLSYLRDSFYEWTDQAAEGNHIIFYLAAKEPGYDYNMVCTLISPQMAEIIGSDEQIFVKGRPLFENVFTELKQDFNKLWAIQAFLEWVEQRYQYAVREQEQEKREHLTKVANFQLQLENYKEWVDNISQSLSGNLESSVLYTEFSQKYAELGTMLEEDAKYISLEELREVEQRIGSLEQSHNAIISAVTWLSATKERLSELRGFTNNQKWWEYAEPLATEIYNLELALSEIDTKIQNENIDYYSDIETVEERYQDIVSWIKKIQTWENIKLAGKWWWALWMLWALWYLNRRKKRIDSREEFLGEMEKLEAWFHEMKRVYHEDIEGNTESIEMFFWDQEGTTGQKIWELKESVAYISVLLPKIAEIIAKAKKSVWITAQLRVSPYERAVDILHSDTHVLDPNESEVDQNLLEKINGAEIQDFSQLIENMTATLPDLVKKLDESIRNTKIIFNRLEEVWDELDSKNREYAELKWVFLDDVDSLLASLWDTFSKLEKYKKSIETNMNNRLEDNDGKDVLGEYEEISGMVDFLKLASPKLQGLKKYIESYNPSKYRIGLEGAGYDVSEFLDDIIQRYEKLFLSIDTEVESGNFWTQAINEDIEGIHDFYTEMKNLLESDERYAAEATREEALQFSMDESTEVIKEHLWKRLKAEVLFQEEWVNVGKIIETTSQVFLEIPKLIQQRDIARVQTSLLSVGKQITNGEEILRTSQEIALGYDTNTQELQSIEVELTRSKEDAEKKLIDLKSRFDTNVLIARTQDFAADESDTNIWNNIEEIDAYFSQLQEKYNKCTELLENWNFLQLQAILEEAHSVLQSIEQLIQEIETVHHNVEQVHTENPRKYEELNKVYETLQKQYNSGAQITPASFKKLGNIQQRMTSQRQALEENTPNPYVIEESLQELETSLSNLQWEFQRDTSEYWEYIQSLSQAWQTFEKLITLCKELSGDDNPDSKEARDIFTFSANIQKVIEETESFKDTQVSDWYLITDTLEDAIEHCERNMNTLHGEEKKRKDAHKKIESAAKVIKKAKWWSGRHTSISSTIWESQLRSAHSCFLEGDFDQVLSYARKAQKIASSAISDAESEDARIKRKKAREIAEAAASAARARRRRSSSSSSSSFWGGFWGGGGWSWFSGWGGF